MPERRRQRRPGVSPRRRLLFRLGAGGAVLLGMATASGATGAFSSLTGSRTSAVDAAADDSGLLGIVGRGPVQKNSQDSMVELTNNTADTLSITVSLSTCTDGTLYDPEGDSGCSVTFLLGSGNSGTVDIEASVTGTIPYSISASSSAFSLDTTETVQAEAGNIASAVDIKAPTRNQEFTAVPPQGNTGNVFEVDKVDIRDNDGDDDLVEVKYEVREASGSGDIIGEKTVTLAPTGRYSPKGNPAETIQPDAGYTIQSGTTYTLTVIATDADGNADSESVEDTA